MWMDYNYSVAVSLPDMDDNMEGIGTVNVFIVCLFIIISCASYLLGISAVQDTSSPFLYVAINAFFVVSGWNMIVEGRNTYIKNQQKEVKPEVQKKRGKKVKK